MSFFLLIGCCWGWKLQQVLILLVGYRWRLQVRKALESATEKTTEEDVVDKKSKNDDDEEEDLATMEELKEYAEAKRQKERKKKAKAREKVIFWSSFLPYQLYKIILSNF